MEYSSFWEVSAAVSAPLNFVLPVGLFSETKMMAMKNQVLALLFALLITHPSNAQDAQSINRSIDAIRKAGKVGDGFEQAQIAAKQLSQAPIDQLAVLLDGMADTNPIAENWIRGVVFGVVRRADEVPVESLSKYAMDQANNPTGRGLAMELIRKDSPATAETLISKCLNDVSLPLREMAVQQKIDKAKQLQKDNPDEAKSNYEAALAAARHPQQLETIVKSLRDLGDEAINISSAFAMIEKWHSLAPFDNVNDVGFDTAYAPEQEFANDGSVELSTEHKGKSGAIKWQEVAATGDKGEVDLAKAYDKEKGAVCYLYTEFNSPDEQAAQLRLGCINANKVWINGQLVMSNHVYHAGEMIDQYIADAPLRKGTNRILLKICQNEQTESWAQDWKFQFRVTDPTGKALTSSQ